MNQEYLKKMALGIEESMPTDYVYYLNPYDSNAILYAVENPWELTCEYKDIQNKKIPELEDK